MKRIFDMNNPVMRALSVVADLLLLNLLTILCSLPVVTAGAAYTALNDRIIHMAREEDEYLVRPFFKAFVSNLKKGSILGILFMAAAGLLYADYRIAQVYAPMLTPGIGALGMIVLAVAFYAFALLARYENTLMGTLKNAALLMVGCFPRTLVMLVFVVGIWLATLRFFQLLAPVMLMLGLSMPCYVCVVLMKDVFEKMEQHNGGEE